MKANKTILIIGGMGPTASWHAHRLLLDRYADLGAINNDDYPTIIHVSINVTDFINGDDEDAERGFDYIKQNLSIINMDSIDTGFIACNTAHILFDRINQLCDKKLISLLDIEQQISAKKIGIVCSPFTAKHNIYKHKNLILPDTDELDMLNYIIRQVISNKIDKQIMSDFRKIIDSLIKRDCEQIIIGCSELSILANQIKDTYTEHCFIDPIELTVKRIADER